MKNILKAVLACSAVAALAAGCDRRDYDNDRVERRVEKTGERVEDKADRVEDKIEQAGKDNFGGTSFEINMDARTVELRRTNNLPGVTDKKDLQSGKDTMTLTFDELAMHVEGDKGGKEIAEELHVGENVNVFMNDAKMVTKIIY